MNNDIAYHLREDASPLCACDQCGRLSWDVDSTDRVCGMTQPGGAPCVGWMISRVRA